MHLFDEAQLERTYTLRYVSSPVRVVYYSKTMATVPVRYMNPTSRLLLESFRWNGTNVHC